MKTTIPMLFLFLTIFLFSNLKQGFCSVVIDTEGNEVQAGADYYILPVFRGRGGGVTLADTGRHNDTLNCPLDVVQAQGELDNGQPLTFLPVTQETVVRVSTDLNIMFYAFTPCNQSTVWTLDSVDESTGQRFITTGGVEGNPGQETLSNWFRIENYDDDYKLVFCPTVCDICRPVCGDIGVYVDENGIRRLAISTVPLIVRFTKIVSLDRVI